jgi:large subunit ribosomal protein L35
MPKMKTNRAAAKRMRGTGSGKVRRASAGLSHLMRGKPDNRRRKLRKHRIVHKADEHHAKRLIPYKV